MMSKTIPLFESSEDKQLFAEIIIDIIESKHQAYEREHRISGCKRVPLANIHFWIVFALNGDFYGIGDQDGSTGGPCLQTIAEMQGKPNEKLLITAQRMLDLFQQIGEIEKRMIGNSVVYKLHKDGIIYKHLVDKLEGDHERCKTP